ncbi:hypothetical protein ULMS_01450 [Patiriisocius marinistellae]|uniref:Photosystem I assembly protein Ycf4 n=1 Tax=Patiriisocius marinistellae TaxID=2494560 RepID=A0A5J4FS10_9FLAO|nr:hypothetical protein [Patiriisocius marinistellae]GEQ84637.1 hypothetical protein ULMS_01450 [Patiriisocius marinistellae]
MSLLVDDRYVVVKQKAKLWYEWLVPILFLLILGFCIWQIIVGVDVHTELYFYGLLIFVSSISAFYNAKKSNFIFDFKRERFKEEIQVGIIKFGWWEPMPSIEYISIYKEAENKYFLKIFISFNDGYLIEEYNNREDGIEAAYQVASRLNTSIWDGTILEDRKWIKEN